MVIIDHHDLTKNDGVGDVDDDQTAHIINGSNNLACQQERHASAETIQHLELKVDFPISLSLKLIVKWFICHDQKEQAVWQARQ